MIISIIHYFHTFKSPLLQTSVYCLFCFDVNLSSNIPANVYVSLKIAYIHLLVLCYPSHRLFLSFHQYPQPYIFLLKIIFVYKIVFLLVIVDYFCWLFLNQNIVQSDMELTYSLIHLTSNSWFNSKHEEQGFTWYQNYI